MHNFLYNEMLIKKANMELNYEALENKQGDLFQTPKVEISKPETNPKPKERKVTNRKGDGRPAYYHEDNSNNPYNTN